MAVAFCQYPIRIAPELRAWLDQEAARRGVSVNATVVQCLEEARLRQQETHEPELACPVSA